MALEKSELQQFSIPFHKSLTGRDLIFGVPPAIFYVLSLTVFLLIANFHMYVLLVPYAILIYIARIITKSDEWLLDIVLESLFQPDEFD